VCLAVAHRVIDVSLKPLDCIELETAGEARGGGDYRGDHRLSSRPATRSNSPASAILDGRPAGSGSRNPKTGESIQIAAKTTAKFSPGAELKKAVNG
jgi:hypothetical protein